MSFIVIAILTHNFTALQQIVDFLCDHFVLLYSSGGRVERVSASGAVNSSLIPRRGKPIT